MIRSVLLAASVLALASCGQQAAKTETAEAPAAEAPAAPAAAAMTDADFVQAVATSDAFEIQSSELAATHAARPQVKEFAAMMVRDHRGTTSELTALLPSLNLSAPSPQFDATQTASLESLRGQSGAAFDDAYLDAQVAAHENGVRAFERYIAGAPAGPLRDWATTTLPKLRAHLSSVQALENAT
jgi:putative membrane protein